MTDARTDPHSNPSAAPREAAIEFIGVTRRFGHHTVVDDLTLACPPGSITGLIGLNGAGKSTALRMAVNSQNVLCEVCEGLPVPRNYKASNRS